MKKYPVDFSCQNGERFVWEQEGFHEHAARREELRTQSFIDRIVKACCEFDTRIKSYLSDSLCYYHKEYTVNGTTRYTKVIASQGKNKIHYIQSAYRPDKIKELQYHKPE